MECPECHKEHSAIAEYCPHCGATLPTPPAEGVAVEVEKMGIAAESASAPRAGGRRTATKILVPVVTILVVTSGIVTYVARRHVNRVVKTVETNINNPLQTLPAPSVTLADEDAAYSAALQYALTRGELGLQRDGVSITSSIADVWLKDPITGKRYRVSLFKAGGETGWVAMSMEEV